MFDYIYGVLHSPDYRATFAEFLKIDFPRVPWPAGPVVFANVSEAGEALRRLHLMEAPAIGDAPFAYHGDGDDVVAGGYPKWTSSHMGEGDHAQDGGGAGAAKSDAEATAAAGAPPIPTASAVPLTGAGRMGRVHINADQYFADVPEIAWNFHIGGYQPARKWLKDRKGRALSWGRYRALPEHRENPDGNGPHHAHHRTATGGVRGTADATRFLHSRPMVSRRE